MTSREHRAAVRFRCAVVACAAAVLLSSGPVAVQADGAYFMGLSSLSPGIQPFDATGVSYDGSVIVGHAASGVVGFGFKLEGGQFTNIGEPPVDVTVGWIRQVSRDGTTIVGYGNSPSGLQAFRWTAGTGVAGLGDLPGGNFYSIAEGASSDGNAVVGGGTPAGAGGAFRWTLGTGVENLGVIPGFAGSYAKGISADGSVVVGSCVNGNQFQAFRWTAASGMTGLGDFPGGDYNSQAQAVSADGAVVVGGGTTPSGYEAYRWTAGTGMIGLGDLPGGRFHSYATGISDDRSLIVGRSETELTDEAFVWDAIHGMRPLEDFLSLEHGLDLTGWTLLTVHVSGDGQTFVGQAFNPSGQFEAYVAHIPEPGSLALLALAGLLMSLRRSAYSVC